jgi:hypothetical protein
MSRSHIKGNVIILSILDYPKSALLTGQREDIEGR